MSRRADPSEEREIISRFQILCRMTDEYLSNMTPQERDRMVQVHLAQARGPKRNGDLLRQMTDAILTLRAGLQASEPDLAALRDEGGV